MAKPELSKTRGNEQLFIYFHVAEEIFFQLMTFKRYFLNSFKISLKEYFLKAKLNISWHFYNTFNCIA